MMQEFERNFLPTEIQLSSGAAFDYSKVNDHMMELGDICKSLALISRFNGHTIKHLSVAQHSALVGTMMELDGCSEQEILYGYLHDASESVYCDLPQPLKMHFRESDLLQEYVSLEEQFVYRLYDQLGVPRPTPEIKRIVKKYDILSLEFEMANCLANNKLGHSLVNIEGKHLSNLSPQWKHFREILERTFYHEPGDFAYSQNVPWNLVLEEVIDETLNNIRKEKTFNEESVNTASKARHTV